MLLVHRLHDFQSTDTEALVGAEKVRDKDAAPRCRYVLSVCGGLLPTSWVINEAGGTDFRRQLVECPARCAPA